MNGRKGLNVVLFCGGRGSATLIRELVRRSNVNLTLLVNAYDDGLSTGALRNFIPGMLGPSDFRKNLSYLVDPYSAEQYTLQRLLEYRMPADFGVGLPALATFSTKDDTSLFPAPVVDMLGSLDAGRRKKIRVLLGEFAAYADGARVELDYADAAFGNLVFAGAFLNSRRNFNAAIAQLGRLFHSRAQLINVSLGENRTLCALKEDGQLLKTEADVVGPQSPVAIHSIYFLERPISVAEWTGVADKPVDFKDIWLKSRERTVELSPEADEALADAHVIIYGPGTQHSSLFPSYRIAHAAIAASPASLRALVLNLQHDHDIQALSADGLVDCALMYLNDPENERLTVTSILYDGDAAHRTDALEFDRRRIDTSGRFRGARVAEGTFHNAVKPTVHNGHAVVETVVRLYGEIARKSSNGDIDIYVDLVDRSLAVDVLLQEFQELDWLRFVEGATLRIHGPSVTAGNLPSYLSVETVAGGSKSEVETVFEWLDQRQSEYLATISGDGEYRLADILGGIRILQDGNFGAVYGSRTQSRRQFRSSLRSAYGEASFLYWLSWFGAFVTSAVFGARYQVIFSDPLTGFRMYRRSGLKHLEPAKRRIGRSETAAAVTKLLLREGIEIAEIPVQYRTFSGFTSPKWRLRRGIRNLLSTLR